MKYVHQESIHYKISLNSRVSMARNEEREISEIIIRSLS